MILKFLRQHVFFFLSAALLINAPLAASAQQVKTTRQIRVTVVDEGGSAVPEAKVQFKRKGETTGTVNTDQKGEVVANNFPPGSYEITASKDGFEAKTYKDVLLTDEMSPAVKFELKVKTLSDKVEISASTSPTALPEQTASAAAAELSVPQVKYLPKQTDAGGRCVAAGAGRVPHVPGRDQNSGERRKSQRLHRQRARCDRPGDGAVRHDGAGGQRTDDQRLQDALPWRSTGASLQA
jgi:hypothetical protein